MPYNHNIAYANSHYIMMLALGTSAGVRNQCSEVCHEDARVVY